jgi:hypothetical protein
MAPMPPLLIPRPRADLIMDVVGGEHGSGTCLQIGFSEPSANTTEFA